jgi:hypothetical protein
MLRAPRVAGAFHGRSRSLGRDRLRRGRAPHGPGASRPPADGPGALGPDSVLESEPPSRLRRKPRNREARRSRPGRKNGAAGPGDPCRQRRGWTLGRTRRGRGPHGSRPRSSSTSTRCTDAWWSKYRGGGARPPPGGPSDRGGGCLPPCNSRSRGRTPLRRLSVAFSRTARKSRGPTCRRFPVGTRPALQRMRPSWRPVSCPPASRMARQPTPIGTTSPRAARVPCANPPAGGTSATPSFRVRAANLSGLSPTASGCTGRPSWRPRRRGRARGRPLTDPICRGRSCVVHSDVRERAFFFGRLPLAWQDAPLGPVE